METDRKIYEGWSNVNGKKIDDLEAYVFNYMAEYPDTILYVGTDSAKQIIGYQKQEVKYLSVICFRRPNKGAHVIKCINRIKYNYVISLAERLGKEIDFTRELAFYLKDDLGLEPEVHLDVNPKESEGSSVVYRMYKGYFESLGFKKVEFKPQASVASSCADYFLGN